MSDVAKLDIDGQQLDLSVIEGTEGERALDIGKLRAQTGFVTLDRLLNLTIILLTQRLELAQLTATCGTMLCTRVDPEAEFFVPKALLVPREDEVLATSRAEEGGINVPVSRAYTEILLTYVGARRRAIVEAQRTGKQVAGHLSSVTFAETVGHGNDHHQPDRD